MTALTLARARVVALTIPLLSTLVCVNCSSSPVAPAPLLSFSATTLAFPQTAVGDTATMSVTLSTATAETIGLADTDTADFPFTTTCVPSFAAGTSCSLTVQFHPNVGGALSAWIYVNSETGVKTSIQLTGTAVGSGPTAAPSFFDLLEIVTSQPNPFEMSPGQTIQLGAAAITTGSGAQDVTAAATWSSSDSTVVTVSPAGLVSAVGDGVASISATYQGHLASIRIFVVN